MSDATVKITINANGSARIECARAEIHLPDGTVVIKENKFSLCRCGNSNQKPFCDGTHKTCGFVG
jgi:CDGSH-type Zn-finger protein